VVYIIGTAVACAASQSALPPQQLLVFFPVNMITYRLNYSTYVNFKGTAKGLGYMYSFEVYAK
jgi:hypothetical protein